MSQSGSSLRRIEAAKDTGLDRDLQLKLSRDPLSLVRLALAKNPGLLEEVRLQLTQDSDFEVASVARQVAAPFEPDEATTKLEPDIAPVAEPAPVVDYDEIFGSLERLGALLDAGRISVEEYAAIKESILGAITSSPITGTQTPKADG